MGCCTVLKQADAVCGASLLVERLATHRLSFTIHKQQEAKWRALGPDWDTSALEAVAGDAALSHLRGASDSYASRGWFQRFRLHGLRVGAVTATGPGSARVEASVRESSSMYGVDGRRGDSVTSEYGVVYRLRAGADGRWRVANFKVVGKEPGGAWLAKLFGRGGN